MLLQNNKQVSLTTIKAQGPSQGPMGATSIGNHQQPGLGLWELMGFCFASNQGPEKKFPLPRSLFLYPSLTSGTHLWKKRKPRKRESKTNVRMSNHRQLFSSLTFCHFSTHSSVLRSNRDNWVRVQSVPPGRFRKLYRMLQRHAKKLIESLRVMRTLHIACCCRIASHQVQSLSVPLRLP